MAEQFIVLLYTKDYVRSILIFRIYLLMIPLRLAPYSVMLLASGHSKEIFKSTMIFLILNTVLNVIFIKIIGFAGPAIATVLAVFLSQFLNYFMRIKRIYKIKISDLLPFKIIRKHMLVTIIPSLFILPIIFINFSSIISLTLSAIIFFGVYILLIIKLKILKQSDKELIMRWIKLKVLFK